jgi:hypothetical protein
MARVDKLLKCSDQEILDALEKCNTRVEAAETVGLTLRRLYSRIAKLKEEGQFGGGVADTVPEGHQIKGVSSLYNASGGISAQGIKTSQNAQEMEEAREVALKALAEKLPAENLPKLDRPAHEKDLLNLYILTDFHLGMKAWGEETRGPDWDIDIAEQVLVDWFAAAIAASPPAHTAILGQLGDFLHWDGLDAVTPTAHNVLDADTRFQKVVRVAIRAMRRIIMMLRAKHPHTHIIVAEGNHDPAASIWMREFLSSIYRECTEINVDRSADPYYCYEWGDTSLFFHHGHKRKPNNIDDVFVAKFREEFGRTKFSYAHMGHMHSVHTIESNLMIVEQHRTLASRDAYASRGGWISGGDASCITYHKDHGQVGRVTIRPEMLNNEDPRKV